MTGLDPVKLKHRKLTLKEKLEKKGISPVIATIIIVAVAIAISIAVASWLMGLWTGFTKSEQLSMITGVAYKTYVNGSEAAGLSEGEAADTNATIWIKISNTGGADAEIDSVYVYNKNVDEWKVFDMTGSSTDGVISAGSACWIAINYTGLSTGQSVEVRIVTKQGTSLPCPLTVAP